MTRRTKLLAGAAAVAAFAAAGCQNLPGDPSTQGAVAGGVGGAAAGAAIGSQVGDGTGAVVGGLIGAAAGGAGGYYAGERIGYIDDEDEENVEYARDAEGDIIYDAEGNPVIVSD